MGRVEGKVCLVTGGASGLGRADAIRLAEQGAIVVVTDVDVTGGEETAQLAGGDAIFMEHDVSNEDAWLDVLKTTVDKFGKLNVLVNNAGIVIPASPEEVTNEQWRLIQSINTDGVFYGIKHGISTIKQNGELGSIINMSSTAAMQGYPAYFAYAASKGAVRSMTKSAAVHCVQSGYKIRVNSLHPGGIATQMTANIPTPTPEMLEIMKNMPPGPGIGQPDDVAYTVLFLASDESKHINGVELPVDNTTIISP
ncbi:MAG: SDR family oxidoreductase [Alphaproteobacteria bacterium]|nr:MAG: SDR family oxidoreductase [Alphaproteobacteria bacterium]